MSKPIKRSEHLIQLSREHHFSLLFCWKVRTGIKKNIDKSRITPYILSFWKEHLLPHFEEEDVLFEKVDDELVQRAYKEHQELNQTMELLHDVSDDKAYALFAKIADLVDDHVRFEERVLFPHLEDQIEENELAEVARKLLEMQPHALQDEYEDEFWK